MAHKISSPALIARMLFGCTSLLCVIAPLPLQAQAPAPEEDIRGPRGLIDIPTPPPTPDHSRWWITAGIFLFAIGALLLMRRWKKNQAPLAPEVIATQALQQLQPADASRPADAFANDVSAILRRYIQSRFAIAATQRSTEEFLQEISANGSLGSHHFTLQSFMRCCDQAKFATSALHADVRRRLIEIASTFVKETTPAA